MGVECGVLGFYKILAPPLACRSAQHGRRDEGNGFRTSPPPRPSCAPSTPRACSTMPQRASLTASASASALRSASRHHGFMLAGPWALRAC
eukprot:358261-Chlamydomonas_euryale.AAC.4